MQSARRDTMTGRARLAGAALVLVGIAIGCGAGSDGAGATEGESASQSEAFITACHFAIGSTCHAGTRSCGTCACREERPSAGWPITAERCLDAPNDDDCDQLTNEGCPTRVDLESVLATPLVGGSGGGSFGRINGDGMMTTVVNVVIRHTDGEGRYLAGFSSTAESLLPDHPLSIGLDGSPVLGVGFGAQREQWLEYVPTTVPPFLEGQRWSNERSMACPPGKVVIGIEGRAGSFIDSMAIRCATPRVVSVDGSNTVPGGFRVDLVDESTPDAVPATFHATTFSSGGSPYSLRCPASSVVIGWYGRSGSWIDAIGLYCGMLVVR